MEDAPGSSSLFMSKAMPKGHLDICREGPKPPAGHDQGQCDPGMRLEGALALTPLLGVRRWQRFQGIKEEEMGVLLPSKC